MDKIKRNILLISILFVVLIFSAINTFNLINKRNYKKPVVYLVLKTINPNIEFWESVKKGAELASVEFEVDVIVEGAIDETNVEVQGEILEEIIEKKPKAVVLAVADYQRIHSVAEKIIQEGITLVTIDSDVKTDYKHSFVATNNTQAAKKAGKEMARILGGKGQVAVMSHFYASTTAKEREEGFREEMENYEDIKVIDKTWNCNSDVNIAYQETLSILEEYPNVDGIFGSNEMAINGISKAINDKGLAHKIKLIGFDSNPEIVQLIEEDVINAVMVQRPFNMGYIGIKKAVEETKDRRKPKEFIDTGCVLITKENIYEPENQKLIFPFSK